MKADRRERRLTPKQAIALLSDPGFRADVKDVHVAFGGGSEEEETVREAEQKREQEDGLFQAVEDENAVAFKGAEPVDTLTVTPAVTTNYDMLADGVSRRMTVSVTIPPPVEDREMTINGVTYRTIAVTP